MEKYNKISISELVRMNEESGAEFILGDGEVKEAIIPESVNSDGLE